ncbi:MAG: undecaprenyl/decaprenyl-phosphate alpha-N-acetylglucosaminyl 1-phosphate transferase [Deltaproteobacteria bacterium]|nr:undecaprenyl/decaprenyl-phosphate alpha-N-acetylglucosaminyl 1-phosphate transferase [Deltaproteobacteria bacterium]
MRYFLLFALPFGLSLILTPFLIRLNTRQGLLDLPDDRRKLHAQPVPTAGGLAVLVSFLISLAINQILFGPAWGVSFKLTLGLALGCALVGLLGLIDDWRRIGPWAKIGVQLAGGVILYLFDFRVEALTHPFGDTIDLGWLGLPTTLIWVLLVTNAINLIDGVDGLAAGIVTISLMTLTAVSLRADEIRVLFYAGLLASAVAGFYYYNFPPAKIFLGDCGSLMLGFALAAISLIENRKGTTALSLLVPLVAMGVPILDTGLAFLRRSRNGINPFKADHHHLHHRLLRLGLTPKQVVMFFIYASLYLGVTATLLAVLPKAYVLLMVAILGLGVLVAMQALQFLEKKLCLPESEETEE